MPPWRSGGPESGLRGTIAGRSAEGGAGLPGPAYHLQVAQRRLLVVLAGLLGLAGCSWDSHEPGLFSTPGPSVSAVTPSPTPSGPPLPTDPALPVAGETVWTTAEGRQLSVRFAVHAVRRTENATVLDWSVTPLAESGRSAGQPVPSSLDLGLGRALGGGQNVLLLDEQGHRAYRPLTALARRNFSRCLCTPLFAFQQNLRFSETRLLQLTFPLLPSALAFVDVQLPNVAAFSHVPLTPAGQAPVALSPTDLTRPADPLAPATTAHRYTDPGPTHRRQTVRVDRVVASAGLTSVVWTVHSVDDRSGFSAQDSGPPVARPVPDTARVVNAAPASGPLLSPAGRPGTRLGVLWTTADAFGLPGVECVCSDFDVWATALRQAGGSATVQSALPPLPAGVTRVRVRFPGVADFTEVPVQRATDGAARLGAAIPVDAGLWTYDELQPPPGWTTQEWPTPTPDARQVTEYQSRTERLLDRPG